MSTYNLPGKGIPAVLRRAAGMLHPGGSRKAKAGPSFYDVIRMAQVAVKVYQDMLRSDGPGQHETPPDTPSSTEASRLRQRSGKVWLALGLAGRDLVTDAAGPAPTEEELKQVMLEELRRGFLERLDRIIQTLQRWLNLFALFLSRAFFFEFPNNLRHLCTTMPWSIWPALVVLWGVCWMFYSQEADRRDLQAFESLPGHPQVNVPPLTVETSTHAVPVTGPALGDWNVIDIQTNDHQRPDWTDPMMLSPASFTPHAQSAVGQWSGSSPPAVNMFSAISTPEQVSQATMALPIQPTAGAAALGLQSLEPSPSSRPAQEAKSPSAPIPIGTPLTPPLGSAGPVNLVRTEEAGVFKCPIPGCKSKPFRSEKEAKKHRLRHERRFGCPTCGALFSDKSDLNRHATTVHGPGGQWVCVEPECKRQAKPFSRKDNFVKHVREVHKRPDFSAQALSLPSAEGTAERRKAVPGADVGERREACDCNRALRRENEELRKMLCAKDETIEELREEIKDQRRKREIKKKELAESREKEKALLDVLRSHASGGRLQTAASQDT